MKMAAQPHQFAHLQQNDQSQSVEVEFLVFILASYSAVFSIATLN